MEPLPPNSRQATAGLTFDDADKAEPLVLAPANRSNIPAALLRLRKLTVSDYSPTFAADRELKHLWKELRYWHPDECQAYCRRWMRLARGSHSSARSIYWRRLRRSQANKP